MHRQNLFFNEPTINLYLARAFHAFPQREVETDEGEQSTEDKLPSYTSQVFQARAQV